MGVAADIVFPHLKKTQDLLVSIQKILFQYFRTIGSMRSPMGKTNKDISVIVLLAKKNNHILHMGA